MSLRKVTRAATFIFLVRPNSPPCLRQVARSEPPIDRPSTSAPLFCAASRNEEKSEALIGTLALPSTLPPACSTKRLVSSVSDAPKALSVDRKYHFLPPALTVSSATDFENM